jgi:hypothetical protein
MGIFRKRFVIASPYPVHEAWKQLLPVVQTDVPMCAQCGQTAGGGVFFCSHCGEAVPPPLPPQGWVERLFATSGFEFEGDISPQGFTISRIVSNRNPCLPVIRGRFEPSAAGTAIVIDMKMHLMGYLFLVASMGFSFFVLAVIAVHTPEPAWLILLPFAAPCFFLMLCCISFAVRANMASATLSRLWERVTPLATNTGN